MITRSIFDPGNPNVERSGDTFTGPDARSISKMPEDAIDGVVEPLPAGRDAVEFDATGQPVEPPPDVDGQMRVEEDAGMAQVQAGDKSDASGQENFENPEEPPQRLPGS